MEKGILENITKIEKFRIMYKSGECPVLHSEVKL